MERTRGSLIAAAKRGLFAVLALCLAAPGAFAANVAVFNNGTYSDIGPSAGDEATNVQASLTSLGHTVSPFSGITAADFTAALSANDFVFFPEMENRNLNLDLDPAARSAILSAVSGGKTLVTHNGTTLAFLNGVFGLSLVNAGATTSTLNAAAAAGTAYAGGPATIPSNDATTSITSASFPAGSRAIYTTTGGAATVLVFPIGSGQVIFLGWDWFNSNPPHAGGQDGGWINVLGRTVVAASAPAGGVDISASTPVPVLYAQEIVASAASPVTLVNNGGSLNLTSALGYSFTQGEVRYARVECPATVRFLAGSTVVSSDDPASTIGSINGIGGNAITFSITADTTGLTAADTITVTGDRTITAATNATCSFSLYDNPSEAQAGGAGGRIATRSGEYLRFGPSYALRVTATGLATADVEGIDGPYTRFTVAAPTNDATRGQLGGVSYGTVADVRGTTQPLTAAGTPVTLADLMGAQTALVFGGDFEAAASVYLSANSDCSTVDATADSYDTTRATFQIGDGDALGRFLCFGAGTAEIQPGAFTVALEAEAASAAYAVSNLGPENLGEIVRNGTELMAPLVQMPTGFIARIVLTNTGTEKRRFTLQLLSSSSGSASEIDSTYVGITSSDGTIPADGSVVINVADAFPLERFQGPARAAIRAIVAGPNNQIQGLYQIVNPTNGTISNHVMVRPGSN